MRTSAWGTILVSFFLSSFWGPHMPGIKSRLEVGRGRGREHSFSPRTFKQQVGGPQKNRSLRSPRRSPAPPRHVLAPPCQPSRVAAAVSGGSASTSISSVSSLWVGGCFTPGVPCVGCPSAACAQSTAPRHPCARAARTAGHLSSARTAARRCQLPPCIQPARHPASIVLGQGAA